MKKSLSHLIGSILLLWAVESSTILSAQVTKEFKIDKQYLNFPVVQSMPGENLDQIKYTQVQFIVDDQPVLYAQMVLAPAKEDFWVYKELSEYEGKNLKLVFDQDHPALDRIHLSDTFPGQDSLYRERTRPQYHFSSRRGWLNDPNGLVWSDGKYHLFYQHNPYSADWDNLHWGHAVSKDLIHWKETRDALCPDELGAMFSGSAVIDKNNTAGFGKNALVAIYTAAANEGFSQCLAYSNDNGKTIQKYEDNPVIKPFEIQKDLGSRDPKVFWNESDQQWVMLVFGGGGFSFFTSPDLKKWEYQSFLPGYHECPDIFPLPLDGNPKNIKWVVSSASGAYAVGSFDGHEFKKEQENQFMFRGRGYASQTFNNEPEGRVVQITYHRANYEMGMPFNQQMALPVELSLRTTREGIRLYGEPVKEVSSLHGKKLKWKNISGVEVNQKLKSVKGDMLHVIADVELLDIPELQVLFRGNCFVNYQGKLRKLNEFDFQPEERTGKKFKMEFFIDKTTVDAFFDDGKLQLLSNLTPAANPAECRKGIEFANPENIRFNTFTVYQMKSIWK